MIDTAHEITQLGGTWVHIDIGSETLESIGAYAATKYALEGMTEALHAELIPFGIRVLLVEPGAMDTRFTATSRGNCTVETLFSNSYQGSLAERAVRHLTDVPAYTAHAGSAEKAALHIVEAVDGTGTLGRQAGRRAPPPLGQGYARRLEVEG
ncbi:uncharacterized protein PG986_001124 [Apiospora aurea]|uniref:Uncharacterized protein n=1 Tax=Apiospora aurea TaxID=335848 RepID=A0ABR1QVX5_9PEZI